MNPEVRRERFAEEWVDQVNNNAQPSLTDLLAAWGENETMENRGVAKAERAEALGLALKNYATDRHQWRTPSFAPFVPSAATTIREARLAREKAQREAEERAGAPTLSAVHEAGMQKLMAERPDPEGWTPGTDPREYIRSLSKAKSIDQAIPGAA